MRCFRHRWGPAIVIGILSLAYDVVCSVQAQQLAPIDPRQLLQPATQSLRLEVFVNGHSTRLVEPFTLTPDNRLFATRSDLEEIGLKVSRGNARSLVDLADLAGVKFRYDPRLQRIDFDLNDADRLPRVYDARANMARPPPARADWGTILNYTAFGTTASQLGEFPRFQGFNVNLDARAFGPYGAFTQTGIVGDTIANDKQYLRLDSTYAYSDQDLMITGRAGDSISGGLAWSRPIRFGGVQLQRNFGLRSDLVTQPLPAVSGTAVVPSTVDIFVNNVKTYSQAVAPGPYSIANLPVVSGNGAASVIVTDATGRQMQTVVPFFSTRSLLAPGLTDFSFDAGFARRDYGTMSDNYDTRPLGMATARHGYTEWLTVEAHAEGGAGLMNAGAGATARIGRYGTLSLAGSGSYTGDKTGGQVFAGYNIQFSGITVDASTQRTFSAYNDLASVTATSVLPTNFGAPVASAIYAFDPRPPAALDRVTVGAVLPFDSASVSASIIHLVRAEGTRSQILAASYSRPLPYDASFFATGFMDLSDRNDIGVYVGLSIPLGGKIRASVAGSFSGSSQQVAFDVGKPLDPVDNSFAWRLRAQEGQNAIHVANAAYRSPYGTATAEVRQQDKSVGVQGSFEGSVGYVQNGGPFVANRITDGFAVVNTGLPDIPIYQDNRLVGKTNALGRYVVSNLASYQANQIGIDPLALPTNVEAATTRQVISTRARSGVAVNFGIDRQVDAALVVFHDAGGAVIAPGSRGHVADDSETFVVGYGGQGYLKHLKATNTVVIDLGDKDCTATFDYRPQPGERPLIGPVTCR